MKGGNQLRNFVASQARELSVESFSKVMNEVYKTIGRHVNLNPKEDKLAAVQAIDCLLELDYDENENANKISKFGKNAICFTFFFFFFVIYLFYILSLKFN